MTRRPKVLFIADKWCAGNERFGTAEWENNLWRSLKTSDRADVRTFHFDEYYAEHKKRADLALRAAIEEDRPDMICLVLYAMPGSAANVLSWETLKHIKGLDIPMLAIWGDLELKEQIDISKALLPYVTLNMATASSAALRRIGNPEKYLYMWVPKNPDIFNDPGKERDISLSYVGSPKKDRLARVRYLEAHGVPVTWTGGERQAHLTVEEYADIFKRSKITLSFARAHVSHVINARPFEAMLCGAMLLEQENFETPKLYTPFVDYVPYTDDADLLEKATYYLAHDEERERIAKNGYAKTARRYSAARFWDIALYKVLGTPTPETYDFEYALKDSELSRLLPARARRLKLLDAVCSHPASFLSYTLLQKAYWEALLFGLFKRARVFLETRLPKETFDAALRFKRRYFNIF